MKRPLKKDYFMEKPRCSDDIDDAMWEYNEALENYVDHLEQMNSSNDIQNVSDFKVDDFIAVGCQTPERIISIIESKYPKYKGLCIYNSKTKELDSIDNTQAVFYYDPYHGVIRIYGK